MERQEEERVTVFSRIPSKTMHSLIMAVLSLVAVVMLSGCPNPEMRLFFGEERKSSLAVRKLDGRLRLRVDSFTERPCGDYYVHLSFEVAFSINRDDLVFRPGEIQILVADSIMQWVKGRSIALLGDTTKYEVIYDSPVRYKVGLGYKTYVEPSNVPINGELPVKVVLNDFITYKGQTVQFDTIQAVERKGCHY